MVWIVGLYSSSQAMWLEIHHNEQNFWRKYSMLSHVLSTRFGNHTKSFNQSIQSLKSILSVKGIDEQYTYLCIHLVLYFPGSLWYSKFSFLTFPSLFINDFSPLLNLVLQFLFFFHHSFSCHLISYSFFIISFPPLSFMFTHSCHSQFLNYPIL